MGKITVIADSRMCERERQILESVMNGVRLDLGDMLFDLECECGRTYDLNAKINVRLLSAESEEE